MNSEFGMWNAESRSWGPSEGGKMDEKRRMREDGRGMMDERRTNKIKTVRDLKVYRKDFDSAIVDISMKRLSKGLTIIMSTYLQC